MRYQVKLNKIDQVYAIWCPALPGCWTVGDTEQEALEKIKYSYCTTEFLIRRDLYYWPIKQLNKLGKNLIPAEVTEFGKLVVENNILSKRNILKLVNDGFMSGFDDPRLLGLLFQLFGEFSQLLGLLSQLLGLFAQLFGELFQL